MREGNWEGLANNIYNDLAFALYEKFPILSILKKELIEAGALCAEITGSGPTLFGLCKNKKHAEEVIEKLNPEYKETFYCGISRVG